LRISPALALDAVPAGSAAAAAAVPKNLMPRAMAPVDSAVRLGRTINSACSLLKAVYQGGMITLRAA
jgi:hypothetical protein